MKSWSKIYKTFPNALEGEFCSCLEVPVLLELQDGVLVVAVRTGRYLLVSVCLCPGLLR